MNIKKFVQVDSFPKVGLICKSCYFPRLTELELVNKAGGITHVGVNYFLLHTEIGEKVIIKYNHYKLVKDKFYEPEVGAKTV